MTLFDLRGFLYMFPHALADPVQPMPYRVVSTDRCRYPTVFYSACCRTLEEAQEIANVLRFASKVAGSARRIVIEGEGQ